MNRFLLATDLSMRSDRALKRALSLAQEPDAELTVVHVVDRDPEDAGYDAAVDAARRALEEQLASEGVDGGNVRTAITHGRAFAEVLRAAQECRAELILFGYQRDEPFRTLFLGSTIDRVLRVGATPSLVVKRASTRPYRRVLVGVDFSPASRSAVHAALALADAGAEVRLVHAYEVVLPALAGSMGTGHLSHYDGFFKLEATRELNIFRSHLPADERLTREIREGEPKQTLLAEAERMDADLVAIGTHGRGWLQSAVLGRTAAGLVRELDCDVLASGPATA